MFAGTSFLGLFCPICFVCPVRAVSEIAVPLLALYFQLQFTRQFSFTKTFFFGAFRTWYCFQIVFECFLKPRPSSPLFLPFAVLVAFAGVSVRKRSRCTLWSHKSFVGCHKGFRETPSFFVLEVRGGEGEGERRKSGRNRSLLSRAGEFRFPDNHGCLVLFYDNF